MDLSAVCGLILGSLAVTLYATGMLRPLMLGLSLALGAAALLAHLVLFLAIGAGFGLLSTVAPLVGRPRCAAR